MRPVQWRNYLYKKPVDDQEAHAVGAVAGSEFRDIKCIEQREGSQRRGGS